MHVATIGFKRRGSVGWRKGETKMRNLNDLKKVVVGALLGMAFLLVANSDVNGQSRREIERERQRIERENARYQREQQRRNRNYRNGSAVTRRSEQRVANANFSNGYQYGFMAGEYDRRRGKYNQSN